MKWCKCLLLFLFLTCSLIIIGSSAEKETNDEQNSSSVQQQPKGSLWQKIATPIMSWFGGRRSNKAENEFELLKSNWTTIFENMQKEMLRVHNRRWDSERTANGEEKVVKVPNWEDIFQFVYIDQHTTIFMGNTFESAAERAYSCKRAFEVKEWSIDELKKECKLPKKMGRENAFKLWTKKTKQFEAGQNIFECMQWTKGQEEKKLAEIFKAFLDGAPMPTNICHEEEFREIEENEKNSEGKDAEKSAEKETNEKREKEKENSIIKERNSWEKIREQWQRKEAETERERGGKEESGKEKKEKNLWTTEEESESREREERERKKGQKIAQQRLILRKKIEEQRNKAYREQESGEREEDREREKNKKRQKAEKKQRYGTREHNTVAWHQQQSETETETETAEQPIHGHGHVQYGSSVVGTVKEFPQRLRAVSTSKETELEMSNSNIGVHYGTDEKSLAPLRRDSLLTEPQVGGYGSSKESTVYPGEQFAQSQFGPDVNLSSAEEVQSTESDQFYDSAKSETIESDEFGNGKDRSIWRISSGTKVPTDDDEERRQFETRKISRINLVDKNEDKNWEDNGKNGDDAEMQRKEQKELFDLANAEPTLWLNEFAEPWYGAVDQRVANWQCHTLTDHAEMADCSDWEEIHRAIKRFIKFRIAKETESGQNDDRFLSKLAIRPRFFTEKKQLDGQNGEIPLILLMKEAKAVYSGQMELDKAPTMQNKVLVKRVEELAQFLKENLLYGHASIGQANHQDILKVKEILKMVNESEQILEGMADEKSVPFLPNLKEKTVPLVPNLRPSPRRKVNLINRKRSERIEPFVSSSVESRKPFRITKIHKNKNSDEKIGEKSEKEKEKEEEENEKYKGQFGILHFAKRHNSDFWLGAQNSANLKCKRAEDSGDLCKEWTLIERAIRRYLAFLETIEGKAMADFRESDLFRIAVFPRLRPEADSEALTINNKAWIARLWGKFMTKDNGQYMDLKEAIRKVEEAHKLAKIGQVKEPMEFMNKTLVERVEGWAKFYEENENQSLSPSIEEARSILTYVLVQTFDERNRITPKIDMKIVKMPPEQKEILSEKIEEKNNIKSLNEKLQIEEKNGGQNIGESQKMQSKIIRNRTKTIKNRRRKSSSKSKSKEAIWKRRRALNGKIRQNSRKLNQLPANAWQKVPKTDENPSVKIWKKVSKIDENPSSNENNKIYERKKEFEGEKKTEKAENRTPNIEEKTQIWEQKREFNAKIRKIVKEIFGGIKIYLAKGKKPIKTDAIWPIFDGIESAKDEKQLNNVEKMIPPKETDEEKEIREKLLEKWRKIEQTLREQLEKYGSDAYANRMKSAKTNAPNQLVIVYTNFFGFKKYRVVLIPNSAEVVHTVYQVKNSNNNTYSMLGANVFEAWKRAAKCVEIVQNGQIYVGGKECKVEIEAESRAEMFRKWTNLGKALQFKIGALYKENDGMFDDQKFMLLLEQAYGALLNGSALPPLPPNVSGTVEQKLYGEMLEKSAKINEGTFTRAISTFTRQKTILSENPIGDMKRILSEKAREMLRKFWSGESVYLVKTKPVNSDTIWRLFDQIDRSHDEKAVKNVQKQFPDEGPPEMREYQLQKWQEIEQILREQMETYGRERYALRLQNVDTNSANADDVLVLHESKLFGLLRKKRSVLIPKFDEIVHTVYRIEKPDKKTGFAIIECFGPNIFGAWKRAAQCLDAVKSGQQYASANEDCNWQMRTEYRHETAYKRWTNIGRTMKRGTEAFYKVNEEILDEQKLLQLLEKAFFALVNGTELPSLPEKVSADEIGNLKGDGRKSESQRTESKSQTEEAKNWWDKLKSYLPLARKAK